MNKLFDLVVYADDAKDGFVMIGFQREFTFLEALEQAQTAVAGESNLSNCSAHIFRRLDDDDAYGFKQAVLDINGSDEFVDYQVALIDGKVGFYNYPLLTVQECADIHEKDPLEFLQFADGPGATWMNYIREPAKKPLRKRQKA